MASRQQMRERWRAPAMVILRVVSTWEIVIDRLWTAHLHNQREKATSMVFMLIITKQCLTATVQEKHHRANKHIMR